MNGFDSVEKIGNTDSCIKAAKRACRQLAGGLLFADVSDNDANDITRLAIGRFAKVPCLDCNQRTQFSGPAGQMTCMT